MKQILVLALIALAGSVSFAGDIITCKNTGFSNLTVKLQVKDESHIALKVTAGGGGAEYAPRAGESATLIVDNEASEGSHLILRSREDSGSRNFELSMPKNPGATFKAILNSSTRDSDSTFNSFEMTCLK